MPRVISDEYTWVDRLIRLAMPSDIANSLLAGRENMDFWLVFMRLINRTSVYMFIEIDVSYIKLAKHSIN
jgi:hypothetical protein